mmetsp:Transcript_13107/g.19849  ORF Transcript_13107/g.19849 Transcript_13107/m.19849 type:complete len:202 (-) Transcript_13107:130-735(-)
MSGLIFHVYALAIIMLSFVMTNAYNIPCVYSSDNDTDPSPAGCEQRILPCDQVSDEGVAVKVSAEEDTWCYNNELRVSHTVKSGANAANLYYVEFDDQDGDCYAIRMYAGENWGSHPSTGSQYGCQGRCGSNCGRWWTCSNWGRDCLKHDVCSYFFGASDGASDANCGNEFVQAGNDFATCCLMQCTRPCMGPSSSIGYFP